MGLLKAFEERNIHRQARGTNARVLTSVWWANLANREMLHAGEAHWESHWPVLRLEHTGALILVREHAERLRVASHQMESQRSCRPEAAAMMIGLQIESCRSSALQLARLTMQAHLAEAEARDEGGTEVRRSYRSGSGSLRPRAVAAACFQ